MADILKQIRDCEIEYHRQPNSVALLAASKAQPIAAIRNLYHQGQRLFGENYLQEALDKMSHLQDCNIEWHFIGALQSNKAKKVAEHFAWVQSVESKKIATKLNEYRPPALGKLNICIEVNINNETSKHGVQPENIFSLIDHISTLDNLLLRGLMVIPKESDIFSDQCKTFKKIYALWNACKHYLDKENISFDTLSMGMSFDFAAAIKEGTTMIRIGRKLFGDRPSSPPSV